MERKYAELTEDLKYALRYCVVNYVLMNRKVVELKAKHFNHIPNDSPDYDEYVFCDREAYFYLREIVKIKNFIGGKGYYGLTNQDMARKYSNANFNKFKEGF